MVMDVSTTSKYSEFIVTILLIFNQNIYTENAHRGPGPVA